MSKRVYISDINQKLYLPPKNKLKREGKTKKS